MILVRLKGGLGNQMFQYALGRVLAIKNKTELGLDTSFFNQKFPANAPREYNLEYFNINARVISKNKIPILLKIFLYFFKIIHWRGNIYLNGYFQSENFFKEYKEIIKKDLTPKEISIQSKNLINEIEKYNSVCMHVRRGDYVGNNFHPLKNISYYEQGIQELETKTKIDKIYIFSDDIEWCKENIKLNYKLVFINKHDLNILDYEELYIMSKCKYFILANSSFSWWGAWLADFKDKIVIAPKEWFTDKSIDTSNLIPPEWIRI